MPDISIVIPNFNKKDTILETLFSVKNQTSQNWECIIVDDHSTDNSHLVIKEFIKNDERFLYVNRPDNYPKGANGCRNYGEKISNGNYMIFLDADDLLAVNCIEMRSRAIMENPEYEMSIFPMGRFKDKIGDSTEMVTKYLDNCNKLFLLQRFLNYDLPWQTSCVLWEKNFFRKIEGFDTNLYRYQDFDLHIKSLINVDKINCYPDLEPDCYYRKSTYLSDKTIKEKSKIVDQAIYILNKYDNIDLEIKKFFFGYIKYLYKKFFNSLSQEQKDYLKRYVKELKLNWLDFSKFVFASYIIEIALIKHRLKKKLIAKILA